MNQKPNTKDEEAELYNDIMQYVEQAAPAFQKILEESTPSMAATVLALLTSNLAYDIKGDKAHQQKFLRDLHDLTHQFFEDIHTRKED